MFLEHNLSAVIKFDIKKNLLSNNLLMNTFMKDFLIILAKTLWDEVSCPKFTTALPKLQLNVIYDSTWSFYDTLQFLR